LIKQFDAADDKSVKAVVEEALSRWGRLDAFFANAGVAGIKHFHEIEGDEFMEVMRINTLR
jgi:NAD(P)-dependent dehydrogenase (short-subunit alcohol dehydrogenase family)